MLAHTSLCTLIDVCAQAYMTKFGRSREQVMQMAQVCLGMRVDMRVDMRIDMRIGTRAGGEDGAGLPVGHVCRHM